MRLIYHIVDKHALDPASADEFRAESLVTEGFIHCSNRDQVARVANLFYADYAELLVLCIDKDRLTSPVRDENPGTGELFPHVYGPINRDAIVEMGFLTRDSAGRWVLPSP